MEATELRTLFETIKKWYEEDVPDKREQNDQEGRRWYTDSINWDKDLKVATLKKSTNREALNSEYTDRFKEDKPDSRRGISAHKLEISQLYSFTKTFVQRYKSRYRYYQDDTSQKKARIMYNVWQSFAVFERFKNDKMNTT